jgi:hypothetical protein
MISINKKRLFSALAFVVVGFVALQVPLMELVGSKVRFTLFDAFGPVAGAFLGTIPGVITVAAMEVANWLVKGHATDMGTLIRFIPMLFAVWYFSKPTRLTLVVPALCMIAFWAHPEGRSAWMFPLLWVIPFVAYIFRNKFVFAKAVGATFTAHAVGGALWIWAFNLKAAFWIGLLPVVIVERLIFAAGITLVYLLVNSLLGYAVRRQVITGEGLALEKR